MDIWSALGVEKSLMDAIRLSFRRTAKLPKWYPSHMHLGVVRFVWIFQRRQVIILRYMRSRAVALKVQCGVSLRATN